jgi:hypothetical protein
MARPPLNDRYRIEDELGRGGMSTVVRGRQLQQRIMDADSRQAFSKSGLVVRLRRSIPQHD